MLIIEVFMRNIVATLIYSDNAYTMYSIITKDNVVQFSDEGYASSPLLRVAVVGGVLYALVDPPGESYPPAQSPKKTTPICTLLPPPEWYNA